MPLGALHGPHGIEQSFELATHILPTHSHVHVPVQPGVTVVVVVIVVLLVVVVLPLQAAVKYCPALLALHGVDKSTPHPWQGPLRSIHPYGQLMPNALLQ